MWVLERMQRPDSHVLFIFLGEAITAYLEFMDWLHVIRFERK